MHETEFSSVQLTVNHGPVPSELNLCPPNKLVASAKSPVSSNPSLGGCQELGVIFQMWEVPWVFWKEANEDRPKAYRVAALVFIAADIL